MGAMDTIIRVEISGALRIAAVTKQKDAEAAPPIHSELKSVLIGEEEGGDPIKSAIVEYRSGNGRGRKLSRNALAVCALVKGHGFQWRDREGGKNGCQETALHPTDSRVRCHS